MSRYFYKFFYCLCYYVTLSMILVKILLYLDDVQKMFNTKKIAIFVIILLTFVSNFLGVSNANTILPPLAPYPTNIPTQFTPFNKTSIISWKPWTVDNSLSIGDFTPLNQTFGVRKGALIPFYSNLLTMYQNDTHLQYSIKLLS